MNSDPMPHNMPDIFYQDRQLSTETKESAIPWQQLLWKEVIVRIVKDALGKIPDISREVKRKKIQKGAIYWFLKNGKDFQETCLSAGFEPELIRTNVIGLLKREGIIE